MTEYWLTQLQDKCLLCARATRLDKVLSGEQVLYRNMALELKHPSKKSTKGQEICQGHRAHALTTSNQSPYWNNPLETYF